MRIKTGIVAVAAIGLLTLSACGSGSDTASPNGSGGSTSAGTAALDKKLEPHLTDTPTIPVEALAEKPPTGKKLSFISCPLPTCKQYLDALQAASKKIGWTVRVYDGGLTPATQASAWNSVAQDPGDAVVAVPTVPNPALSEQLGILESKKVPVVQLGGPSEPTGPVIGHFNNAKQSVVQGGIWADWIAADSGADAKIAYYTDTSFESLLPYGKGFSEELKAVCPTCTLDTQTANYAAGIGTTIPAQVVSYLQRNPNVKYVVINVGEAAVGVPQALAAAGLQGKVKLVTGASGVNNVKAIAGGQQAMAVVGERYEFGWRAIDLIIRSMQGVKITDPEPVGSLHIITKANLPKDVEVPFSVPGYEKTFLTAWGVKG